MAEFEDIRYVPPVTTAGGTWESDGDWQLRRDPHTGLRTAANRQIFADYGDSINLLRMIGSRLRVADGAALPFEHIHAFRINEGRAGVVVVHNGHAILIEDEWALFPSDALITQLRLLAK